MKVQPNKKNSSTSIPIQLSQSIQQIDKSNFQSSKQQIPDCYFPYFSQKIFNPYLIPYPIMPPPSISPFSTMMKPKNFFFQPPLNYKMQNQQIKQPMNPQTLLNKCQFPCYPTFDSFTPIPTIVHPIFPPSNQKTILQPKQLIQKPTKSHVPSQKTKKISKQQRKPKQKQKNQKKLSNSKQQKINSQPYQQQQLTFPKRKLKKQQAKPIQPHKTRQQKQGIQKIMIKIMKNKSIYDRVIKIGKQYQASIPQPYLNQNQYFLSIKLFKKYNLMSRLISFS